MSARVSVGETACAHSSPSRNRRSATGYTSTCSASAGPPPARASSAAQKPRCAPALIADHRDARRVDVELGRRARATQKRREGIVVRRKRPLRRAAILDARHHDAGVGGERGARPVVRCDAPATQPPPCRYRIAGSVPAPNRYTRTSNSRQAGAASGRRRTSSAGYGNRRATVTRTRAAAYADPAAPAICRSHVGEGGRRLASRVMGIARAARCRSRLAHGITGAAARRPAMRMACCPACATTAAGRLHL